LRDVVHGVWDMHALWPRHDSKLSWRPHER
jgi:hypothetical protein